MPLKKARHKQFNFHNILQYTHIHKNDGKKNSVKMFMVDLAKKFYFSCVCTTTNEKKKKNQSRFNGITIVHKLNCKFMKIAGIKSNKGKVC